MVTPRYPVNRKNESGRELVNEGQAAAYIPSGYSLRFAVDQLHVFLHDGWCFVHEILPQAIMRHRHHHD